MKVAKIGTRAGTRELSIVTRSLARVEAAFAQSTVVEVPGSVAKTLTVPEARRQRAKAIAATAAFFFMKKFLIFSIMFFLLYIKYQSCP
jgi:hypothetical protein